MKKILTILQPSVIDYERKVYSHRDSGIGVQLGMLRKIGSKYRWVHVLPKLTDGYHTQFEKYGYVYQWDYPLNTYEARFKVDINSIPKMDYDFIQNNIPEKAKEIKTIYYDVPLMYANYFIDTPTYPKTQGASLYPKQLEGAISSDILTFTTESIREDFIQNAPKTTREILENKPTYILDVGFSAFEIDSFDENKFNFKYQYDESLPIVFFPNRISKPDYTNFEKFAKAIQIIESKYPDFKFNLFIANPSGKYYTKEDFKSMFKNYISTDLLSREEYLYILKKAHCVITLFLYELYGGCANTEAIYAGTYPIMPKVFEYAKRAPEDYPFFVNLKSGSFEIDEEDLANKIYDCLNSQKDQNLINWMRKNIYEKSSLEKAAKVLDLIIQKHSK